ncbi:BREX-1 system adenine-specific DNA-methyltransferase PglX, partial [Ruminococcus sp.]|uniref:BREX-1 system adenine-specific DNA-methyltransferase PglX n=1 Tax=Ruminococcus sp. TaxID=41978 RepID=UPI0025886AF7
EKKDAVFAAMSNKVKVSKENIAAATQLFTPDWIVRYMVENSLGRLWVDGHTDTSARSEWKYYLDEAEQTPDVQAQLAEIRAGRKGLTPEQIRFIDPCMGSGHILVYAFDVLMQIYLSCGYTERDAAQNIVRNNLWGLDLDKRAYQLAYFAVMMKARQYDRRFLTRGIKPNLSHFQDLPTPDYSLLDEPIKSFVEQFENADTYGSLITVQADDEIDKALDDFQGTLDLTFGHMEHLMQLYNILSQRYDVVCTNPPYMAMSNANAKLKDFVEKKYPDSKSDLFAVFIEKCSELSKLNGYYSMITQHAWMFLSSYEKLRKKLQNKTTVNMAHLGARAFDEIAGEVVQTTSFINANYWIKDYKSTYCRLVNAKSEKAKEDLFLKHNDLFFRCSSLFSNIPSSPIAYWKSNSFYSLFSNKRIAEYMFSDGQILTGNNDLYLRYLWEVEAYKVNDDLWRLHTKGGNTRKWYGNIDMVVHWDEKSIYHYRHDSTARLLDEKYWDKHGIVWNGTCSPNNLGARYLYSNESFNKAAPGIFLRNDNDSEYYYLAFINSCVGNDIMTTFNSTLYRSVADILRLPIIINERDRVEAITAENIELSKVDWDSFETSWDFKKHPFIRSVTTIKEAYEQWEQECNDRRAKLKANEEELNRIFIEIYGLQDELTPEVDDKDITVRAADLQRDMRSFVSYAVGCMFGRYSLDTEGLAYAGG